MKTYHLVLLLALLAGCGTSKSEEVQIRDLTKAQQIISDNNENLFRKVELRYKKDSSENQVKVFYHSMKKIDLYKSDYLDTIITVQKTDIKTFNQQFTTNCFALLTAAEQKEVRHELEGSILCYPELLDEVEYTSVIPHQLALEAEIFVEEVYKVLLKDFMKTRHKLDWDVIYDEHRR